MRIYIAEDDPSVIGVLEDILESSALGRVCGASEEGAPDPERIMALDPDLVLVDLLMPGRDGIQLVRELKELGSRATVVATGGMAQFIVPLCRREIKLEKDLLLPFREQTAKLKKGEECLVGLYVDKSGRLCATMKVYEMLRKDSPYKKDDKVQGIIYEHSDNFGWFVAVDDQYCALIPKREAYGGHLQVGDKVHARVIKVREDGKLDLSVREKAFIQMDADAELIVKRMEEHGGKLPFTDKADPEKIKNELGLSKNAFKRAVGRLLKENKVIITEKSIEFLHK